MDEVEGYREEEVAWKWNKINEEGCSGGRTTQDSNSVGEPASSHQDRSQHYSLTRPVQVEYDGHSVGTAVPVGHGLDGQLGARRNRQHHHVRERGLSLHHEPGPRRAGMRDGL